MRVGICLVSHGAAYREHEQCLSKLRVAHPDWVEFHLPGMPCVDIGRASVAESALRWAKESTEKTMLLWLDADMTFSVETCEQVLAEANARDALVGCLYAGKKFGAAPQVAWLEEMGDSLVCFKGGSVVEVEAIGFGCVAMPAAMLEIIAEKLSLPRLKVLELTLRPWFTTDTSGRWPGMHSDDYAFCKRAREAGFKIFADSRQRVGHIGLHTYFLEDAMPLTRFESLTFQNSAKKAGSE